MSKIDENKQQKKDALLESAYELFITKGFHKTSILEIALRAGVAKGTFYLYFPDKECIRNNLIAEKSAVLFQNAMHALPAAGLRHFEDKLVFIADHILSALERDKPLVQCISKNLSWGIFNSALIDFAPQAGVDFRKVYANMIAEAETPISNPEIMLFLIVDFIGATCSSAILYNEPVSIDTLRPFLFSTIRSIIRNHCTEPC